MCSTDNKNNINNLQPGETPLGIKNPVGKRLFTLKEASLYLGRGVDSLREMIYSGVFPIIQEGNRSKIWLDVKDLDAWADGKKHYMGRPHDER